MYCKEEVHHAYHHHTHTHTHTTSGPESWSFKNGSFKRCSSQNCRAFHCSQHTSFCSVCSIKFLKQWYNMRILLMPHTLSLLRILLRNRHAILKNGFLKQYQFSPSKRMGMCVLCVTAKITLFLVPSVCVLSYNIAICDVSAGCLAGPDDLHHLPSFEAVVPRNGIRNLYSW